MSSIVKITASNYKEFSNGEKPLVLDFWAEWCGPCKMFSPIFEQVSQKLGEKFIFGKVNADDEAALCAQFGIRGIPTLKVIKDGQSVATKVGMMSASQFEDFLNKIQ